MFSIALSAAKPRAFQPARLQRALLSTQMTPSLGDAPVPPMPQMDGGSAAGVDSLELSALKQKERIAGELARQMIAEAQARAPNRGGAPSA